MFHPFDVSASHIVYACLGGFVVLFGMFSLFIREKLYIGEAIWAFLFGVVIGPYGGNIFNPRSWSNGDSSVSDEITLEVTRVVLAIGVFAIGVELPKQYMKRHWKSLFFLLAPVMTWGWFVSAGLVFALIPGLDFLSSLAVAACLTPTDPILAAAVVGGKYADKHVPAHLRHLLAAESGCNDGAAFPFLFIALYLTLDASDAHAIEDWFLVTWLYEVLLGVILGSVVGIGFRHLMKFCERKDLIDRQSYVAQYVSLAVFTIGMTTLLGSDDLLAAFACGTAFAWDGFFNKQTEESVFSSVIDLLFNVAAFVYIGAWMPFSDFNSQELTLSVWRLIIISILVLLLRRLPVMMALYKLIPDIKTFREALFSGHFGPMGVGAVFISTLAKTKLPEPESPPANQVELLAASIQPVVAFMVLVSIITHGLSIPFFSLGRRVHSVSRTWSRHQSIDPTPEWTNQIRKVARPEDIVINRDNNLERGEMQPDKETLPDRDSSGEKEKDTVNSESVVLEGHQDEEKARHDNAPDAAGGDPQQMEAEEWEEGPHLVIERHVPGEEVEVEVHRNALGKSPTDTGADTTVAQDSIVGEVDATSASNSGKNSSSTVPEDEGWSDEEISAASSEESRSKPPQKSLARMNKRRRNSIRQGVFSRVAKSHRPRVVDQSFPDAEDNRGRPTNIQIISNRAQPVPTRQVDSLRLEARKAIRPSSPVRSIRWEDLEEKGGPSTPRSPRTPDATRPGTPTAGQEFGSFTHP